MLAALVSPEVKEVQENGFVDNVELREKLMRP